MGQPSWDTGAREQRSPTKPLRRDTSCPIHPAYRPYPHILRSVSHPEICQHGGEAIRSPFPSQHPQHRLGRGRGRLTNPKSHPRKVCQHLSSSETWLLVAQSRKAARGGETSRSTEQLSALLPSPDTSNRSCIPRPDVFGVLVLAASSPALSTHFPVQGAQHPLQPIAPRAG